MPKRTLGLTAKQAKEITKPGRYAMGGNLYLQVGDRGRSWIFRYQLTGPRRYMGIGSCSVFSLTEARERAAAARKLVANGIDPIAKREAERQAVRVSAAKVITFRECAEKYIVAHRAGWKNGGSAKQWSRSLEKDVYPAIGALPVDSIDTALVMKVLEPIWTVKPETASRIRGRIEAALGWATVRGFRNGDNPAMWRGHLENLLPKKSKVKKVKHMAALPYQEVGGLMVKLRGMKGVYVRALEFLILTAARPGEVAGARFDEFDLTAKVWTIPGERMKRGKEHRVPLSDRAAAIINEMQNIKTDDLVFPGHRRRTMHERALIVTMERAGVTGLTAHGFRATFRDWAGECTNFPREIAEQALAHAIPNATEAAYRRGDFLQKRRRLMDAWGRYCATVAPAGEVVSLRATE
jgi:integrase